MMLNYQKPTKRLWKSGSKTMRNNNINKDNNRYNNNENKNNTNTKNTVLPTQNKENN